MRILGVDIGIRNFAWYGAECGQGTWTHLDIGKTQLVKGHYRLAKARTAIRKWARAAGVEKYDLVVLEKQMRLRFVNLQYELERAAESLGAAVVVSQPGSVKSFLGTRGRNYRDNKRKAVELCRHVLPDVPGKKDDLADAFLLVYHQWSSSGNNLTVPISSIPRYDAVTGRGQGGDAESREGGREEKVHGGHTGGDGGTLRLLDSLADQELKSKTGGWFQSWRRSTSKTSPRTKTSSL